MAITRAFLNGVSVGNGVTIVATDAITASGGSLTQNPGY